jgi:hypothetical protein
VVKYIVEINAAIVEIDGAQWFVVITHLTTEARRRTILPGMPYGEHPIAGSRQLLHSDFVSLISSYPLGATHQTPFRHGSWRMCDGARPAGMNCKRAGALGKYHCGPQLS